MFKISSVHIVIHRNASLATNWTFLTISTKCIYIHYNVSEKTGFMLYQKKYNNKKIRKEFGNIKKDRLHKC